MNRRTCIQRLARLAFSLLFILGISRLTGLGNPSTLAAHAQSNMGWSEPAILFADMVNSYKSSLVADQFGAAHLIWAVPDDATYYYSRWNGEEWTTPIDVIAIPGDGELVGVPELVAASDGKLHLFWALENIMHSWAWADAADSARAWSTPEVIVFPEGFGAGPMGAREDLIGGLHLVYAVGRGNVYYVHSDDGLHWSEPSIVSQVIPDVNTSAPKLDIGQDGRVHVVWNEWPTDGGPAQSNQVYYTHSADGGETWTSPRQLGGLADSGGNVLADEKGTVYLAWQAGISSSSEGRFLQRSTDGGDNWETPVNFGRLKGQSGAPSMALDSAGTLHLITGDGEYVYWDSQGISQPLDLRPLYEQTENSRLVVVHGNQVLAVIIPFFSEGLYYSVRQLPLPAAPADKPPMQVTHAVTSTVVAEVTPIPTGVAIATVSHTIASATTDRPRGSFVPALLLSVGLSLLLVVTVFIGQTSRRR